MADNNIEINSGNKNKDFYIGPGRTAEALEFFQNSNIRSRPGTLLQCDT